MTLLQLTDSFFPTGAFAHSFGLETYVQRELVNDPETFEAFLRSTLHHGLRNGDAVAIGLTYKATEIERVIDLDARLTAMKIARELREGSIKIGKQFLRNAAILERNEMLNEYAEEFNRADVRGTMQSLSVWLHPLQRLTYSRRYSVICTPTSLDRFPLRYD